ncbi:MAG: hypothetical protein R3E58_15730 [Phycisphaerae bacterium]
MGFDSLVHQANEQFNISPHGKDVGHPADVDVHLLRLQVQGSNLRLALPTMQDRRTAYVTPWNQISHVAGQMEKKTVGGDCDFIASTISRDEFPTDNDQGHQQRDIYEGLEFLTRGEIWEIADSRKINHAAKEINKEKAPENKHALGIHDRKQSASLIKTKPALRTKMIRWQPAQGVTTPNTIRKNRLSRRFVSVRSHEFIVHPGGACTIRAGVPSQYVRRDVGQSRYRCTTRSADHTRGALWQVAAVSGLKL